MLQFFQYLALFFSLLGTVYADPFDSAKYRKQIRAEIEDGSIVATPPALRNSGETLIVDLGDVEVIGLGEKNASRFGPVKQQLQVESLRRFALTTDADKKAAAPYLEAMEKEIDDALALARSMPTDNEDLRTKLEKHDAEVVRLRLQAFEAVAKARGLKRTLIKKEAEAAWEVSVKLTRGTSVRYTPFLNFLLNENTPERIDWLTATDGDTLKLRGRYRVEFLKGTKVTETRQIPIRKKYTLRPNQ